MWDVTALHSASSPLGTFLLTHPVWDVTEGVTVFNPGSIAFLLTHPVWDVTTASVTNRYSTIFLLTHPVWDVTYTDTARLMRNTAFLLTHPVWDVTYSSVCCPLYLPISTHTSRVGCD